MGYKVLLVVKFQLLFCLSVFGQTFPSDTAAYYIVSAIGNKYLTVKDANVESGARLEIRKFTGTDAMHPSPNQVWTLQEFGNKHHYFIKSRQGKVIDLKDGRTENGAVVQMWGFGGYANHRWQLTEAGDGYFYITNWVSGKLLEVSGGINENGRPVWSYQKNNTAAQKWKFVKTRESLKDELLTGEPTICENKYSFTGTQDIELNTADIKYCPQKEDEWESVVKQQLGISAKNRTNHYIGWSAAGVPGALGNLAKRNWYPVADMKKIHIGKLCEIGYFNAKEETDGWKQWFANSQEKDFSLHVLPTSSSSYQIEKSIVQFDPNLKFGGTLNINCIDNWEGCGLHRAMEGEITPDDEFIANPNNPWLGIKNLNATSSLFLNQNVGMYGPWVNELVHCNHPEIHPMEMFWSETIFPNVHYLCIFQDDSDRFGYYANFPDYDEALTYHGGDVTKAKKNIHPWASTPLSGQFYIAFELDLIKKERISYTIDVQNAREVVTTMADAQIPAREYQGKTRVIKNNGIEVFRVTEQQNNPDDIAIRFELFKNKEGNKILGYMILSAAVSRNLDGKEGYMIIRLDKTINKINQMAIDVNSIGTKEQ